MRNVTMLFAALAAVLAAPAGAAVTPDKGTYDYWKFDYERCLYGQIGVRPSSEQMAVHHVESFNKLQCREPYGYLAAQDKADIGNRVIATVMEWPKGYRYQDGSQPRRPYDPDARYRQRTWFCVVGVFTVRCY